MTSNREPNAKSMLCSLFVAAGTAIAGAALAQPADAPSFFGFEAELVAKLEKAPHEELKSVYTDCSQEAETRMLGAGEAATCSIVYETLKRRVFGGDFAALLAWSRAQRAAQPVAKAPWAKPAVASK